MGSLSDIRAGEIGSDRFDQVEIVEVTGSTNSDVIERAKAGEPEGLVLIAGEQTAGRGRLDRSWLGNPGGSILCSVLVRPKLDPEHVPLLTAAAGLAAREALAEAAGLKAELKWPNDLMSGGRKLGGILTESVIASDSVDFCVVGIGLNVNWPAAEIPGEISEIAISVSAQLGHDADRTAILDQFLKSFEARVVTLEKSPSHLIREYKENCATIGKKVAVITAGGTVEGFASGIDAHGRLLVSDEDAENIAIDAGDLTVIG